MNERALAILWYGVCVCVYVYTALFTTTFLLSVAKMNFILLFFAILE